MIGHVVIPTAEPPSATRGRRLTGPLAVCAAGLAVAGLAWPAVSFSTAPTSTRAGAAAAAAPRVAPPADSPEAGRWGFSLPLAPDAERVVGVGQTVLALGSARMWPVSMLTEDGWRRLLGIPAGFELAGDVAVEGRDGFSIAGRRGDRTVLFDFRSDGRFAGAHTVFGIQAEAMASLGDTIVVFDATRPTGAAVTSSVERFTPPGRVTDAASAGDWLVVLLEDGTAHATADLGGEWTLIGRDFAQLVSVDSVIGVGTSATVGLHRLVPGEGFVRLGKSPRGPVVAWGGRVAVHDWSNDGVWLSSGDDGWERLPLWSREGFSGTFEALVDGAAVPTVIGRDDAGQRVLWQARD